jgi:DNA-binding FadR family transcriptional regulator
VLVAALEVICEHPDVMKVLEIVRDAVGSTMVEEHRRILHEISRQKPVAARNAMVRHLNNVINDLVVYVGSTTTEEREDKADVSEGENTGRV